MIRKVLIANRGEVASRIIRACKELGIKTAVIYPEVDSTALYIKKADEAHLLEGDPVASFLDPEVIVHIAVSCGADAVHPGYGFISEKAEFAELCRKKGLIFVGPNPETLRLLGDKQRSKAIAKKLGVPVIPGSEGPVQSAEEAEAVAAEVGYPVLIKASYGGGGRGIRKVESPEDLASELASASSQAEKFFGSGEVFIEKFIERPHHVEVQIITDSHGNIRHLFERDCSLQRKNQKLVEIAPSLILDEPTRQEMAEAAMGIARYTGYVNAGTVEFLVDSSGKYYFMEVNPRLQVEHPVTESITGIDIVKEQLRIASGERISFEQRDVSIYGNAIEFRVNAEDPKRNFAPSSGRITAYYSPGGTGVRIDGAVYKDYIVPPHFDSLIAKLTVWARTWKDAVMRARRALEEFVIKGVKTTIPFHLALASTEAFERGEFYVGYIEEHPELLDYHYDEDPYHRVIAIAAAIAAYEGF